MSFSTFGGASTGGGFGNSGGGFGTSSGFGGTGGGGGFGSTPSGGLFGASTTGNTGTFGNNGGGFGANNNNNGGGFMNNNNNNNTSGFGGGGGGGFGATTNNTGGFGNTSGFGANNNSNTSGFASTSGGFGTTNNASGGGFGSTSTSGGFGNSTTGGFGTNNNGAFGAASGNSGFGASANTGTSAFGASNTTQGGFGSVPSGGGFGNTSSTFGANTGGTSTFGSSMGNNTGGSMFGGGNNNTNTGFGAQPSGGGGLFGGGGAGASGTGTTGIPYQKTQEPTSSGGSEAYVTITAMPQYATKSVAQLRFEDYRANNGNPPNGSQQGGMIGQQPAAQGNGLFGASNNGAMGGFGQTQQPATGGGLFGQSPPATNNGGGMFGASNNNSTFGASTNTFGSTAQQQNTNTGGGLFGASNNNNSSFGFGQSTTNTFGATPSTGGTSLFGGANTNNTTNTGGAFGQTPQQGQSLFGNNNQQSSNLFGNNNNNNNAQSGGGLFGSSPNPAASNNGSLFGAPAPAQGGGGLFGSTQPQQQGGGLFGNNNTTQNSSGGGLFGQTNPATSGTTGGLFGSTTTNTTNGGGLFGNTGANTNTGGTNTGLFGGTSTTNNNNSSSGSSLFGSTSTSGSSLFGGSSSGGSSFGTNNNNQIGVFGASNNQQSNGFGSQGGQMFQSGGQQQNQFSQQAPGANQQLVIRNGEPYASGPSSQLARYVELAKEAWEPVPNESKTARANSDYKTPGGQTSFTPNNKIHVRPRGYGRTYGAISNSSASKDALSRLSHGRGKGGELVSLEKPNGTNVLSPGVFDLSKRLTINKENRSEKPRVIADISKTPVRKTFSKRENKKEAASRPSSSSSSSSSSPRAPANRFNLPHQERQQDQAQDKAKLPVSETPSKPRDKSPSSPVERSIGAEDVTPTATRKTPENDVSASVETASSSVSNVPTMSDEYVKKLYSTTPSLEELQAMSDEELQAVPNFSVQRKGFGTVEWVDPVDVRGLVIDKTVEIDDMSIEVYMSEEDTPKRGTKLNRPAICTILGMRKPDEFDGSLQEFAEWLKTDYTPSLDAEFIHFDAEKTVWKFKVKHFTKYSFNKTATPHSKKGRNSEKRNAKVEVERETPALVSEGPGRLSLNFHAPTYQRSGLQLEISRKSESGTPAISARSLRTSTRLGAGSRAVSPTEEHRPSRGRQLNVGTSVNSGGAIRGVEMDVNMGESINQGHEASSRFSNMDHGPVVTPTNPASMARPSGPRPSDLPPFQTPSSNEPSLTRSSSLSRSESSQHQKESVFRPMDLDNTNNVALDAQGESPHFATRQERTERNASPKELSILSGDSFARPSESKKISGSSRNGVDMLQLENLPGVFPSSAVSPGFNQADFPEFEIPLERGHVLPLAAEHQSAEGLGRNLRHFRRSFSVSWGPNGELVVPQGTKVHMMKVSVGSGPMNEHALQQKQRLESLQLAAQRAALLKDSPEAEEQAQRDNIYHSLVQQLTGLSSALGQRESLIWSLINTLWFGGLRPDESMDWNDLLPLHWSEWADAMPQGCTTASENQHRLTQSWQCSLDTWLQETLKSEVKGWQNDIALALSCKEIEHACELAFEAGDFRLATLIAQASGDSSAREAVRQQVEIWASQNSKIKPELMNVYRILSGDVSIEQQRRDQTWIRAFALHAWFEQDSTAALDKSLQAFQIAFNKDLTPSPRPKWFNPSLDNDECFDTLYGLLRVAARDSTLATRDLLDPRGFSRQLLNSGVQWMLNQVLRSLSVASAPLNHLEENRLTMEYIFELEVIGRWELGVFVAQFLSDPRLRESCIKELIGRHVDDAAYLSKVRGEGTPTVEFLLSIGVESKWISEAVGIHARYNNDLKESLAQFAEAGNVEEYVLGILPKVAPRAVLDGDTSKLLELLQDHETTIESEARAAYPWAVKAALYLRYSKLRVTVENYSEAQNIDEAVQNEMQECFNASLKLSQYLIEAQSNPATALADDVASEMGTWIRMFNSLPDFRNGEETLSEALRLPAREETLRTTIVDVALSIVETF